MLDLGFVCYCNMIFGIDLDVMMFLICVGIGLVLVIMEFDVGLIVL